MSIMKLKQIVFPLLVLAFSVAALFPISVQAANCKTADGVEYSTFILPCPENGEDGVTMMLNMVKDIFSVLVGIAAVGGIIYGSILYTTAGGSSENTKKGMTIIKDTIIGVIVYILMYVLLNYIIPGGVS